MEGDKKFQLHSSITQKFFVKQFLLPVNAMAIFEKKDNSTCWEIHEELGSTDSSILGHIKVKC